MRADECEFIRISDLTAVRIAQDALRNTLPGVNPVITQKEYNLVQRILTDWAERLK